MDIQLQVFSSPRLAAVIVHFAEQDERGAPTRCRAEAWLLTPGRQAVVGQRFAIDEPHQDGYGQVPSYFLADRAYAWVERMAIERGVVLRDCPSNYYATRDRRGEVTVALVKLAIDAPGLVDAIARTTQCATLQELVASATERADSIAIAAIE
jgi:hypothetical protein